MRLCVALSGVFAILALGGCSPEREHIKVSGPLVVAANTRLSIKSPELLHTPNYFNAVCLLPEQPTKLANLPEFGLIGANGTKFSPKVFVRNSNGMEDSLPLMANLGAVDGGWLCFESGVGKLHSPYSEVVLISSETMHLKSIKWHSSDK